jgi:hypothetical protein
MSCNEFTIKLAKKLAIIHCEAQLKAILENSKVHLKTYWANMENSVEEDKVFWGSDDPQNCYSTLVKVDKDSIINAYDLNNIK